MARKKRPSFGNRPPRRRPSSSAEPPGLPEDLPDRRVIERVMQKLVAETTGQAVTDTPLDRAQDLMYQAFEERDPARRVALAREALAVCPDCADAYVLLAEHTRDRKETLELYRQGVAAGERALGPAAFQQYAGRFWGVLATRPYMRAREGLANALWTEGGREEAVEHLQEMLRLNPNDNQGVRTTLAGFLLFLDRDEDLARLLQQYPQDELATWAYTRALLAFRQTGDTIEARRLLKTARKTNSHVPDYLLGKKFTPPERPGLYSPGDENEAILYIGGFMAAWKETAGAIAWLRKNVKKKREAEQPHAKGPLGFIKKWLATKLPQEPDVWQADCRPLPSWLRIAGEPVRPWMILVTSSSTDLVLAHEMLEEPPSAAFLWDALAKAMQHPAAGEPHRPTELQIRPRELWQSLKPHVEEVGVRVVETDELDLFDRVFEDMCEHVCGPVRPGLLDMPGMTPERVGSYYEAAAEFYRQKPWKKVGFEAAIQIACDKCQSGPWYGVLMGQLGQSVGLALYEDLDILKRMWGSPDEEEENAQETVGMSVIFGEEWEPPTADVDAAKRYNWPLARPDAYPEVFHKDRGQTMRPPLVWELELIEVCLRTLPEFVQRRKQDDRTPEEFMVPQVGNAKVVLSWTSAGDM